ncbi:hypothetical protein [Ponticaulis sp.]|uniref:hypothetical protein n=1 Tax=Ponticaulis sp. TaxID=2020902 RepID=UPI00262FBABA|nr:hypothetical protein [Ponticaulis sp.]MDF1681580.1 hypothetical protein [Ponticaulis sp.]
MLREKKRMYRIGIGLIGLSVLGWIAVIGLQLFGFVAGSSGTVQSSLVFSALLPICGGLGMLVLLIQVVLDRLNSKEDDYYSKNVER